MTLSQLVEVTQKDSRRPGYAGAASDCLLELDIVRGDVERDNMLAGALTFALLAVAEAINGFARQYGSGVI